MIYISDYHRTKKRKELIALKLLYKFFSLPLTYYHGSRGFSLAWLLPFTKSLAWFVCCVVGLFTPRHANDAVNAKSHVREKILLAGY